MRRSIPRRALHLMRQGRGLSALITHLRHKLERRPPRILPRVTIEALTGGEAGEVIVPTANPNEDGGVTPDELRAICRVVRHFQPQSLFEIGTFNGRTTLHLAANSPASAHVYTLDLPPEQVDETALRIKTSDVTFILKEASGRDFLAREEERRKITQLLGDSAAFDYGPYENGMDFVLVDGSHSYEYVVSDTHTALKLLRGGKGIVMWHDYGWREVVRALNEFYGAHPLLRGMQNIEGTSLVYLRIP